MRSKPHFPAYLGEFCRELIKHGMSLRGASRRVKQLEPDIYETEGAVVVVFDAPGVNESDVQLKYVDGEVLVRIDRFRPVTPDFELVIDDRPMSYDGRAPLPGDATVEPAEAEARLTEQGTLRVIVPKIDDDPASTAIEDT